MQRLGLLTVVLLWACGQQSTSLEAVHAFSGAADFDIITTDVDVTIGDSDGPPDTTGALGTPILVSPPHIAVEPTNRPRLLFRQALGSAGTVRFQVEWSTDATFPSGLTQAATVGPVAGTTQASFQIPTALSDGVGYFWRVAARDTLTNATSASTVARALSVDTTVERRGLGQLPPQQLALGTLEGTRLNAEGHVELSFARTPYFSEDFAGTPSLTVLMGEGCTAATSAEVSPRISIYRVSDTSTEGQAVVQATNVLPNLGPVSLEFYIRKEAGAGQAIVGLGTENSTVAAIALGSTFSYKDGDGSFSGLLNQPVSLNTWYHVRLDVNPQLADGASVWVDGRLLHDHIPLVTQAQPTRFYAQTGIGSGDIAVFSLDDVAVYPASTEGTYASAALHFADRPVGAQSYGTLRWNTAVTTADARLVVRAQGFSQGAWQNITDAIVPGNSTGFVGGEEGIDLHEVKPALMPSVRLFAQFTRNAPTDSSPRLTDLSLTFTGPCFGQSDTTTCDDNNACTQGGLCQAGVCVATQAVTCGDGDVCSAEECDPADGVCKSVNTDGRECNDGSLCTVESQCQAGLCLGLSIACLAPTQACVLAGVCNPNSGACEYAPAPDNQPCNDGLFCTVADSCEEGSCVGASRACAGASVCTPGACDEETDACVLEAHAVQGVPCADEDLCNGIERCDGTGLCEVAVEAQNCQPALRFVLDAPLVATSGTWIPVRLQAIDDTGDPTVGALEFCLSVSASTSGTSRFAHPDYSGQPTLLEPLPPPGAVGTATMCSATRAFDGSALVWLRNRQAGEVLVVATPTGDSGRTAGQYVTFVAGPAHQAGLRLTSAASGACTAQQVTVDLLDSFGNPVGASNTEVFDVALSSTALESAPMFVATSLESASELPSGSLVGDLTASATTSVRSDVAGEVVVRWTSASLDPSTAAPLVLTFGPSGLDPSQSTVAMGDQAKPGDPVSVFLNLRDACGAPMDAQAPVGTTSFGQLSAFSAVASGGYEATWQTSPGSCGAATLTITVGAESITTTTELPCGGATRAPQPEGCNAQSAGMMAAWLSLAFLTRRRKR